MIAPHVHHARLLSRPGLYVKSLRPLCLAIGRPFLGAAESMVSSERPCYKMYMLRKQVVGQLHNKHSIMEGSLVKSKTMVLY